MAPWSTRRRRSCTIGCSRQSRPRRSWCSSRIRGDGYFARSSSAAAVVRFALRSRTCIRLAALYVKSNPPNPGEAIHGVEQAFADWQHCWELSGGTAVTRRGFRADIEVLRELLTLDPTATLAAVERVRKILEPLLPKVEEQSDLGEQFPALLQLQQDALIKLGRPAQSSHEPRDRRRRWAVERNPESRGDIAQRHSSGRGQ